MPPPIHPSDLTPEERKVLGVLADGASHTKKHIRTEGHFKYRPTPEITRLEELGLLTIDRQREPWGHKATPAGLRLADAEEAVKPVSTAATPMSLEKARGSAERVLEVLRPHIARGDIAGSIRRGKPEVNDIDIVVEPHTTDARKKNEPCWTPAFLHAIIARPGLWHVETKLHAQSRKVTLGSIKAPGRKCELHMAATIRYGWVLMLRTGPEDFTKTLVQVCRGRNPPHMFRDTNLWCIDEGEERAVLIPTPTEQSVFDALGLPFIPPEERSEAALRRAMR